jgi:hypothetical protein
MPCSIIRPTESSYREHWLWTRRQALQAWNVKSGSIRGTKVPSLDTSILKTLDWDEFVPLRREQAIETLVDDEELDHSAVNVLRSFIQDRSWINCRSLERTIRPSPSTDHLCCSARGHGHGHGHGRW